MRKEVVLAITFGLVIGLVVAFGVWRANNAFQTKQDTAQQTQVPPKNATETKNDELTLSLIKLENNDVITESPLDISGITKPNSHIVVSSEDEDYVITSDNQGNFQLEIDLIGGVNQLLIAAYDDRGNSSIQNLNIIYSTEFNNDES